MEKDDWQWILAASLEFSYVLRNVSKYHRP